MWPVSPLVLFCFVTVFLFILFVYYFWLHWVFVTACGLSLVVASGSYPSLRCVGFSLWWLLLLWSTGFRCVGFRSCGMWAQQLWCMGLVAPWLVGSSRTRLEPISPALASGFSTTAPPGKPALLVLRSEESYFQSSGQQGFFVYKLGSYAEDQS